MPLADNDIKSELSYAFLHAVSARAGCECQVTGRHSDAMGIDARLVISGQLAPQASWTHLVVEVQLKATSQSLPAVKGRWAFPLEVGLYDHLRVTTRLTPLLLVVLLLPADPADWLKCTPRALTLKRCAYWVSLHGAPPTTNQAKQTVYISQRNRFTAESLGALIRRLAQDETVAYDP